MDIKYIFHSGFLVETPTCYLIFDYYKGSLPVLDISKPVIVFCSHSHRDHYNPKIFDILRNSKICKISAVLSDDIPFENYYNDVEIIQVSANNTYILPYQIILRTLASTDCGVAFLLTCPDGIIYHAGDLNDWVWDSEPEADNLQMTLNYQCEIDKLTGYDIDIAFVPLDPRQKKYYARGILYFLKKTNTKAVYPMHYWKKVHIIKQFLYDYPQYSEIVKYTEI